MTLLHTSARWDHLAFLALLLALGSPSVRAADPTIEDILKVWEARAKKAEHVKLTWKSTKFAPKGAYQDVAIREAEKGDRSIHPPEDLVIEGWSALWLSGNHYRFEKNEPQWQHRYRSLMPSHSVWAFDGQKHISYMIDVDKATGTSTANVRTTQAPKSELRLIELLPLMLALRGIEDTGLSSTFTQYEVTGNRSVIRGADCIELVHVNREAQTTTKCWLDPKSEFSLIRMTRENSGKLTSQLDSERMINTAIGVLPEQWTYTSTTRDGKIRGTQKFKDLQLELIQDTDAMEIIPQMKPQTRVYEETDKGVTIHVIRSDGTESAKMPYTGKESNQQVLEFDAKSHFWSTRKVVAIVATILIGGGLLALTLRRWLKPRKSTV